MDVIRLEDLDPCSWCGHWLGIEELELAPARKLTHGWRDRQTVALCPTCKARILERLPAMREWAEWVKQAHAELKERLAAERAERRRKGREAMERHAAGQAALEV